MNTRRLKFLKTLLGDTSRKIDQAPEHPVPSGWDSAGLTASWLGHATVLMKLDGVTILTDPVLFSRCGIRLGPLTVGPKRYVECALRPEALRGVDVILLSHAHMDHMDLRSLEALPRSAIVVTARDTADIFQKIRFRDVIELDWNSVRDVVTPKGAVTVSAFHLRHWGARMRSDDHRGYNAYVIERSGFRVCHMGDTANTDAAILGSRGAIDLIFAPIGAYNPWTRSHCTPEEAVAMSDQAKAHYILPIHHQTFKLSAEPMGEPISRFVETLTRAPERVALTRIGQTFALPPRDRHNYDGSIRST